MLISNICQLGNMLFAIRKKAGLTQAEVAELAGLSDRAYADIERGSSNMRAETLISICNALKITPNDILTQHVEGKALQIEEITARLQNCTPQEQQTAMELLDVYLNSLHK